MPLVTSDIADAPCFLLFLHDAFEKERVAFQVVPEHGKGGSGSIHLSPKLAVRILFCQHERRGG